MSRPLTLLPCWLRLVILTCCCFGCTEVSALRRPALIRRDKFASTMESARQKIRSLRPARLFKTKASTVPTNSSTRSSTTTITITISRPIVNRKSLLRVDAALGILYSSAFMLFPKEVLSAFFKYNFDDSTWPLLCTAVRMVGVNHLGYVAGLLAAPEEFAILIATAFLAVGGILIVFYGQANLEVRGFFMSCTILTALMIVAHILAVFQ